MKPVGPPYIRRMVLIPTLLAFCATPLYSFWPWPQQSQEPQGKPTRPDSLVLELATDKQVYKLGEPIVVTLTLRNISHNKVFLIGKSTSISRLPGRFMLDVYDGAGNRLPDRIPFGDVSPSPRDMNPVELLLQTRMLFVPGDFIGFARSLQNCGYTIRKPDRYRLVASYVDYKLTDIAKTDQIEAAKKHKKGWILKIPLWSKEIKSPSVWIRVVP